MGVCNCSLFCWSLLYVHSSIAIILMGKRELVALLNLSSWCLVMVERLFLAVSLGCLRFVIVVFPDHTHLLFLGWDQKVKHNRCLPVRGDSQWGAIECALKINLYMRGSRGGRGIGVLISLEYNSWYIVTNEKHL